MVTEQLICAALLAIVISPITFGSDSTLLMPTINTDLSDIEVNECLKPTTKSSKPRQIKSLKVSKCCPLGHQFDFENQVPCQPSNHSALSISILYVERIKKNVVYYGKVSGSFRTEVVKPNLKQPLETEGELFLTSTGNLLEVVTLVCQPVEYTRYCIDSVWGSDTLIGLYEPHAAEANLALVTCMAISIVCLATTIMIYSIVKRFGDLVGKSLLMISFYMLLQYFCYIVKYSSDKYESQMKVTIRYAIVCAFYWFTVMWSDIVYSVWIYLPQNQHRKKRREWYCFVGLAAAHLILIAIVTAFGVQFNLKSVYHAVLGIFLLICIALTIASIIGFKRLKETRETAYRVERQAECTNAVCLIPKRTFSKDHIKFIRMMHVGALYLLGYLVVCIIIKMATKSEFMDKTYEIINSMGGVFIFLLFVCSPKPLRIIKDWWEPLNDEYFLKKYYRSLCSCF